MGRNGAFVVRTLTPMWLSNINLDASDGCDKLRPFSNLTMNQISSSVRCVIAPKYLVLGIFTMQQICTPAGGGWKETM